MQRTIFFLALIALLGFGLPAQAGQNFQINTSDGLGAQDDYMDGTQAQGADPAEENTADEGSPFLRENLSEILGDFSVQSQMIFILADQGESVLPASLLSATSSVANVFVGFKILSFEPANNGKPATVSPWNAYMGFSYGLPGDENETNLSPFGGSGYNQEDGKITTHFGVNITF